ncbi:MAG TPA: hypothetical protein VGV09_16130 [Steroidobacteraceae bacterium]|nr:hypothetical protein [Steroidobacteraceae bacterium]
MSDTIGGLRIGIGFVQGIVAWLLLRLVAPLTNNPALKSHDGTWWSERHPMLFAALALITAYVPVIAIAELPRMRRRTLLMYLLLTAAALTGLAAYDIWRDPLQTYWGGSSTRVWPSWRLGFCAALGLFIVNQLLEHRQHGHALFTQYAKHFEDSWMRGFQLVISLIFSLLVWGVLELGATLFDLIKVGWFRTMIQHNWFICPALAMAFAAAIHLTDVRPALLKGMRNVVLTLLSWLLPLMVLLSLAFLIALCFVGLRPLWDTRHAAAILFSACAVTVFLLNAAYKDGDPATLPNGLIRLGGRAAGPVLLPLALIGAYAIALRVNQYGWTPDRVTSAAIALMVLIYSGGYLYAAVRRAGWITSLEAVNVIASLSIIIILALVLTPIADPARLSVGSQLSRLAHGEVSSAKLDYLFLRFDSGIYGRNALLQLGATASEDVRLRATRAQALNVRRYASGEALVDTAATEAAFSHASIYPTGARLPADFTNAAAQLGAIANPPCMLNGFACDVYVVSYGPEGEQALIVRTTSTVPSQDAGYLGNSSGVLFQRDAAGKWSRLGTLQNMNCPGVVAALQNGSLASVPAEHDDVVVAGVRLEFSPARPYDAKCARAAQSAPPVKKDQVRDATAPARMGPAFGSPLGR